ncbi:hypothetical protein V5O48_012131 [Marasmius crinis-equi]|uniref:Uncharacterized protein n=1 Tax=Marasmius crinis-equi TaxID=585013 RepID=A0ABR3F3T8_9AGAR
MVAGASARYNLRRLSRRNSALAYMDAGSQEQIGELLLFSTGSNDSAPSNPVPQVPPQAGTYAEITQAHTVRRMSEDSGSRVSGISDAKTVGNNSSFVVQDTQNVNDSISSSGTGTPGTNNNSTTIPSDNSWTIVRRRARSRENIHRKNQRDNLRFEVPKDHLSVEQNRVIHEVEKTLTPAQRAAIAMRNQRAYCQVNDNESSSEEESVVKGNKDKGKAMNRHLHAEDNKSQSHREQEENTPEINQTEVLVDMLREILDPDVDLQVQRDALETWNANRGIKINAVRTGEPGSSGSNNRDDVVVNPGVLVRDVPEAHESNRAQDAHGKQRDNRRRSKSRSRKSRSKGKHGKNKRRENSKSQSKQKKRMELLNPMSAQYEKKIQDAVRGRSRASGTSRTPECIAQPVNQLPADSLLAQTLSMARPDKGQGKQEPKKRPSKKTGERKKRNNSPSDSSSSSESPSSGQDNPNHMSSDESDSSNNNDSPSSSNSSSSGTASVSLKPGNSDSSSEFN